VIEKDSSLIKKKRTRWTINKEGFLFEPPAGIARAPEIHCLARFEEPVLP